MPLQPGSRQAWQRPEPGETSDENGLAPCNAQRMESFPPSSPFSGLAISSHDPLKAVADRQTCSCCKKRVKFYCPNCVLVIPRLASAVPRVALPFRLFILKHVKEHNSKSTAIHAKLLCPDEVEVLHYSQKADCSSLSISPDDTVILFPDKDSKAMSEIDLLATKHVVLVDGTWSQAKGIISSLPKCYRKVRLSFVPKSGTVFWRYQQLGNHALSSIEALFYLCKEWCHLEESAPNHDNLLWFYSFFYHLIQQHYKENSDLQFTSRHRSDYIKTDE